MHKAERHSSQRYVRCGLTYSAGTVLTRNFKLKVSWGRLKCQVGFSAVIYGNFINLFILASTHLNITLPTNYSLTNQMCKEDLALNWCAIQLNNFTNWFYSYPIGNNDKCFYVERSLSIVDQYTQLVTFFSVLNQRTNF